MHRTSVPSVELKGTVPCTKLYVLFSAVSVMSHALFADETGFIIKYCALPRVSIFSLQHETFLPTHGNLKVITNQAIMN